MTPERSNAPSGITRKTLLKRAPAEARRGLTSDERRLIGELLVDAGLVDRIQLERALNSQKDRGGKIVEILVAQGALDTDQFVSFLARQPGIASLDLSHYEVDRELVDLIPRDVAVKHEVFPIDRLGRLLTVGMACPLDAKTIGELESITGLRVKPLLCAAKDIREAIERYYPLPEGQDGGEEHFQGVAGLAAPLRLKNVAALIRQLDTLPALPETVRRVQEATLDPLSSVRDVADIIVLDPPIAAKVLSVANSAAYGFPQRVDDISLAVALLGLRETYSIVLSAAVVNLFDKSRTFDYRTFWIESMCCAAATRLVAKAAHRRNQVGVFSAGLLHDIGRVALSEVIPDLYGKVPPDATGANLLSLEESVIGLSHTEAGFVLAEHWGLPVEITEPIRYHHRPELAADAKENVSIVALATAMSGAQGDKLEDNRSLFDGLEVTRKVLGLDLESLEAMLAEYLALRDACLRNPFV